MLGQNFRVGVPVNLTSVTREKVFYHFSLRVCTLPSSIGRAGGITIVTKVY